MGGVVLITGCSTWNNLTEGDKGGTHFRVKHECTVDLYGVTLGVPEKTTTTANKVTVTPECSVIIGKDREFKGTDNG